MINVCASIFVFSVQYIFFITCKLHIKLRHFDVEESIVFCNFWNGRILWGSILQNI